MKPLRESSLARLPLVRKARTLIGRGAGDLLPYNSPVKRYAGRWVSNERIIEVPFVLMHAHDGKNVQRILDFGGTRSLLPLQLATLGHNVTCADLRPYEFGHPNLERYTGDVLQYQPEETFDVVIALSVIEHIGLGAYGEQSHDDDYLREVCRHLVTLLAPHGRLLVTTPVGHRSVDGFERSFAPGDVPALFPGLEPTVEEYFRRVDDVEWLRADASEMTTVWNDESHRGDTGVNGVGCFSLCRAATDA